jgi:hypothetical protein
VSGGVPAGSCPPIVSSCVHVPFVANLRRNARGFAEKLLSREGPGALRIQFRTIVALATAFAGIAVGYTPAVAAEAPTIRINEVECNGGTPGDRVELLNTGVAAVDLSGWVVKDNDDTHVFTIAAGTVLAAGAHLALDVDPVFGLGGADSARLFAADGATLIDAYS